MKLVNNWTGRNAHSVRFLNRRIITRGTSANKAYWTIQSYLQFDLAFYPLNPWPADKQAVSIHSYGKKQTVCHGHISSQGHRKLTSATGGSHQVPLVAAIRCHWWQPSGAIGGSHQVPLVAAIMSLVDGILLTGYLLPL